MFGTMVKLGHTVGRAMVLGRRMKTKASMRW